MASGVPLSSSQTVARDEMFPISLNQIEQYHRAIEDRNRRITELATKLSIVRDQFEKERRDHQRLNSEIIMQNVKVMICIQYDIVNKLGSC